MPSLIHALSAWCEAAKRPGVMSLNGWKIVVAFRKDVSLYFRHMAELVDQYHSDVPDAHVGMIEPRVIAVVNRSRPLLLSAYKKHARKAFLLSGSHSVFLEAGTRADLPLAAGPLAQLRQDDAAAKLDKLGLTGKEAVDYITEHGAELVTGIDDYTLKVMRALIAQGIEERLGVQGTVRLLRQEFVSMSGARAKSIATTEINDAMSEASLQKIIGIGLDGKRWIRSPGACPICVGNTAQGIIPVGEYFQSGHQRPPAHPGKCRCAVAGARLPKGEE